MAGIARSNGGTIASCPRSSAVRCRLIPRPPRRPCRRPRRRRPTAIRSGQTIISIEADEPWLSFNAREDRLDGIAIGNTVDVQVSGQSAAVRGVVTEISALGQFATWQAERAVGDHDRNTLRVRVDVASKASKLEPGATVWLVR